MNSSKILALINDDIQSARSIDFAFQLLHGERGLVVAAFAGKNPGSGADRAILAEKLKQRYANETESRFILRTSPGLNPEEIAKESQYADIIVLSPELLHGQPGQWAAATNEQINKLNVPVILVPGEVKSVKHVLLTYDGNEQTLMVIKQFCQIMASLCAEAQVTLLEFNHDHASFEPQEERLLVEYLKQHCHNLGIFKVGSESPDKILKLIDFKEETILVSGTLSLLQQSIRELPALTSRLIYQERTPGFFGTT